MDCDQALELISQRLDERLPLAQEQALARHLAGCRACARVAALMVEVDTLLTAAPPAPPRAELNGLVMARVHRRARSERVVRRTAISVLSVALFVVAVLLPVMRAMDATGGGSVLALALAQVGGQLLDLLESMARPLVTIVRALVFGDSYRYVLGWLAAAVLLVMAWVGVVARAIRPARQEITLSTTLE